MRGGESEVLGDRAVLAVGAHSARLARRLGDAVLLDTERGYHVLFPQGGRLLNRPVCYVGHGFYMTPMAQGLRAAGAVELGGLAAPPQPARTRAIRSIVAKLLPKAGEGTSEWLGFRPSMPDSLPVIRRGFGQPAGDLRLWPWPSWPYACRDHWKAGGAACIGATAVDSPHGLAGGSFQAFWLATAA